jgi:hypothetical protein
MARDNLEPAPTKTPDQILNERLRVCLGLPLGTDEKTLYLAAYCKYNSAQSGEAALHWSEQRRLGYERGEIARPLFVGEHFIEQLEADARVAH